MSHRRSTGAPDVSRIAVALAVAAASLIACGGAQRSPASATDGGSVEPSGTAPMPDGGEVADVPGNAGADGGSEPAASPCSDLLPTFDAPIEVSFALSTYAGCRLATSAPWGQVLLGKADHDDIAFDLYTAAGTSQGRISGITGWSALPPRSNAESWFSWTSDGYVGITGSPPQVSVWDNLGAAVALGPTYAIALAPDGDGGTVVLTRPRGTELWWLDPWAHRIRSVDVEGSPSMVLVAWGTHHVLTVETSATIARARWYDATGTQITPWVDLGSDFLGSAPSMHLLVDGSVALAANGRWRLVLRDGAPTADQAPAWLTRRSGSRLATIRNGNGYAVLGADGTIDEFEIVSAQGESCGATRVPGPGDSWYPSRIDVGQDGTLIEIVNQPPQQGSTIESAGGTCKFRWWPALLR